MKRRFGVAAVLVALVTAAIMLTVGIGSGAAAKNSPYKVAWFYVGPHIMVVLPDSASEALRGLNQDLSNDEPYVTLLTPSQDSTPLLVIPVAKGGERIKAERAK